MNDVIGEASREGRVLRENVGRVAVLTLNQPDRLNALNTALVTELGRLVDEALADRDIGVLVLAGRGRMFSAGGDIAEMDKVSTVRDFVESAVQLTDLLARLSASSKPSIAAVHGLALGGGCELAMACDLRVAEDTARFGLPEIKLGLIPGGTGTARLAHLIPPAIAKQMLLTGDHMSAVTALSYGLVNEVVPVGEAKNAAVALATRIARHSSLAIATVKRVVDEGRELPLAAAIELERAMLPGLFESPERVEGLRAFLEKRTPNFHPEHGLPLSD